MGIITGYLGLVCFCILLAKVFARKFHLAGMNKIMMKIHKPVCVIFSIISILHIILVWPVLKTRGIPVLVTGILAVAAVALIIVLCHTVKDKKLKLRLHRILTALLLCCIVGHIVVYFMDLQHYQNRISEIEIGDVDISGIEDGTYTGTYDAGYIYAEVEVVVNAGQIADINILEHNNERGASAETITEKVVAEQQIDVDAISGATNSSKVIKKAIENALTNN